MLHTRCGPGRYDSPRATLSALYTAAVLPVPIHANHAGTSWPKAPGVQEAVAEVLAGPPQLGLAAFDGAHAAACEWLGIDAPERLLLTPGCTSALSVAIGDLPWQPGDVIVTSGLEHHALSRPVERLVRDRGVVHGVAPYAPGVTVDLDAMRRVLQAGRVRLVATTGASNVSGEVLPVQAVATLAHEYGALYLLDAAQTLGVLPLDVRTAGIDLLAFAGHKAVMAPHGIGGLWAAPHVVFESPSAVCEISTGGAVGGAPDRERGGGCSPFPGYCDVGSVNLAAAAGLGAAIAWHRGQGPAAGQRACALAAQLRAELKGRRGCELVGSVDSPHTATLSLRIEGLPLEHAQAHFATAGITVRAAQHCAPMALQALGVPEGTLRVSFGPLNVDDDVDAVLRVIDGVVG